MQFWFELKFIAYAEPVTWIVFLGSVWIARRHVKDWRAIYRIFKWPFLFGTLIVPAIIGFAALWFFFLAMQDALLVSLGKAVGTGVLAAQTCGMVIYPATMFRLIYLEKREAANTAGK